MDHIFAQYRFGCILNFYALDFPKNTSYIIVILSSKHRILEAFFFNHLNQASAMRYCCEVLRLMLFNYFGTKKNKYLEVILGQSVVDKSKCTLKPILSQNVVHFYSKHKSSAHGLVSLFQLSWRLAPNFSKMHYFLFC